MIKFFRGLINRIRLTFTISKMNVGGELVQTDVKPIEVAQPKTIEKQMAFFTRANNLMEADWGSPPPVSSSNFGIVDLDQDRWDAAMKYEETSETIDEGMTPTYNKFYSQEARVRAAAELRKLEPKVYDVSEELLRLDKEIEEAYAADDVSNVKGLMEKPVYPETDFKETTGTI